MRFKNLGALFLLSLASIYFICPVQCTASAQAGGDTASVNVSSHQQHRIGSQNVDETNPSACCEPESQPTQPRQNHGNEEGHCCFNQWESFGTSEPQLPSQIQKDTFVVVFLIPTTLRISSDFVSFATYIQLPFKPYTDPTLPQHSPRAPPFFLA